MKCALLVLLAVAAAPGRVDAIGCQDGATRRCTISGRPGTQECIAGRWSRCLPDDPGPTPTPPPPPDGPVAAPAHEVRAEANPLNVTTSMLATTPEALVLTADEPAFRPLLEVQKEQGSGREVALPWGRGSEPVIEVMWSGMRTEVQGVKSMR